MSESVYDVDEIIGDGDGVLELYHDKIGVRAQ